VEGASTAPFAAERKINLENDVQFQVNDQTYFLSLAENERRWLVFTSTPTGAMSIPVYVDVAESEGIILVHEEEDKNRVPN
jgi:hypothetical protein